MTVDSGVNWLGDRVVGPLATVAVQWRYLTAGLAIGVMLLAVSTIAGGVLKFSAFPELDGNVMEARILFAAGNAPKTHGASCRSIVAALEHVNEELSPEQPDGQTLVIKVATKFNENKSANESGAHVATITAICSTRNPGQPH